MQVPKQQKEAWDYVGGLSSPSKMPCFGYSISALRCKVGSRLREVADSVCSKCYALRGNYRFTTIQAALERRFESLSKPKWVQNMVILITNLEHSGFFRWHDSGDLQSVSHLHKIVQVAELTPNVKHWLPTREYGIVTKYIKEYGSLPKNLTVRLSGLMIDGPPPFLVAKTWGVQVSSVKREGFSCPASQQGNVCGPCRACWDKKVFEVSYKSH